MPNYTLDLFALFIFIGVVQALFLCVFFFSKEHRKIEANVYEGLLVFSIASCTFEIFLCYTGYIRHCLWLVDFSEPLSFVIGPAYYLMVVSLIRGKTERASYLHFAVAVAWLVLEIPYFIQSDDVKFNAWIGAYHPPGLVPRDTHGAYGGALFSMPSHSELILLHITIYTFLGLVTTFRAFRLKSESFWRPRNTTFLKLRSTLFQLVMVLLLVIVVKVYNRDDMGDHLFAAYMTVPIYLISFQVVRQSGFFRQATLVEQTKYKSSSVTPGQQQELLEKLKAVMASERPFLAPDFSLPELAARLHVSVHQLSQVINEGLGKSFFEMTAEYRVAEAKILLKEKVNLKIEEIAEQVGYLSKSSFNSTFKKITGQTPSAWRGL